MNRRQFLKATVGLPVVAALVPVVGANPPSGRLRVGRPFFPGRLSGGYRWRATNVRATFTRVACQAHTSRLNGAIGDANGRVLTNFSLGREIAVRPTKNEVRLG